VYFLKKGIAMAELINGTVKWFNSDKGYGRERNSSIIISAKAV